MDGRNLVVGELRCVAFILGPTDLHTFNQLSSLGLPSTSFPLPEQLTVLASFPGLHAQLLSLAVRKKAGHGGLGTRLSCPAFSVCMQSPLASQKATGLFLLMIITILCLVHPVAANIRKMVENPSVEKLVFPLVSCY